MKRVRIELLDTGSIASRDDFSKNTLPEIGACTEWAAEYNLSERIQTHPLTIQRLRSEACLQMSGLSGGGIGFEKIVLQYSGGCGGMEIGPRGCGGMEIGPLQIGVGMIRVIQKQEKKKKKKKKKKYLRRFEKQMEIKWMTDADIGEYSLHLWLPLKGLQIPTEHRDEHRDRQSN